MVNSKRVFRTVYTKSIGKRIIQIPIDQVNARIIMTHLVCFCIIWSVLYNENRGCRSRVFLLATAPSLFNH